MDVLSPNWLISLLHFVLSHIKMQNGLGQKQVFENFKHVLTTETTMAYLDSSKNTELYVDAFPFGLGAILTQTTPGQQDTKVIAYASRSLTYTESQYSQIERESLAIVYGIEHFHIYLYGHEFTLVTDYKPLELIYRNPKSRPSARLERWCLRLQDYTFQVKYQTGPANPSDYLSRHPLTTRPDNKQQNLSDEHVRFVVNHAVPVALDVNTIRRATQEDTTCQNCGKTILGTHLTLRTYTLKLTPPNCALRVTETRTLVDTGS